MHQLRNKKRSSSFYFSVLFLVLFHAKASFAFNLPGTASALTGTLDLSEKITKAMVNGLNIAKDPSKASHGFVVNVTAYADEAKTIIIRCMGTAVSKQVVITAGHCLKQAKHAKVSFIKKLNPILYDTIWAKAVAVHTMTYGGGDNGANFNRETSYKYRDLGIMILSEPSPYAVPIRFAPSISI